MIEERDVHRQWDEKQAGTLANMERGRQAGRQVGTVRVRASIRGGDGRR